MYSVSELFKSMVQDKSREFELKATIDSVEYGNDSIVSIEYQSDLIPDDEFTMGTVIPAKLVIAIKTADTINPNAKITPSVRLKGSTDSEWVLLGSFYVDSRTEINGVWKLTCLDKLIITEQEYVSTLTYPETIQNVFNEILTQLGLTADSSVDINPAYQIPYKLEGIKIREMLSYIASSHCSSVKLSKEEKVKFIKFNTDSTPTEIPASQYFRAKKLNEQKTYTKVVVEYNTDAEELEEGSGTGDNTLKIYNPFITETILTNLHTQLNGFSYVPCTVDWRGSIYLEEGDPIKVILPAKTLELNWNTALNTWEEADFNWGDGTTEVISLILKNKFKLQGGLTSTIEAPSKSQQQSEFNYNGSLTNRVKRLDKTAVKEDKPYFGVTIGRTTGLHIVKSDNSSEVVLNSDELAFKVGGDDKLYFDVVSGKYKFIGEVDVEGSIVVTGGSVNGTYIDDSSITSDKISVNELSSITADLGTITAGTIDASLVNVTNIDASNITVGTLSADRIDTEDLYAERIYQPASSNNYGKLGGDYGDLELYYNNARYFRVYNAFGSISLQFEDVTFLNSNGETTYPEGDWVFGTGLNSVSGLETDTESSHGHGITNGTYLAVVDPNTLAITGYVQFNTDGSHGHAVQVT